MSKIEQLITELCPNGVEYKAIGEITDMQRGTSLTKNKAIEGNYPVISGGKEPAFYCNQFNREGETITVAGSGVGAGYIQYWNIPIFANDCFTVKGKEDISTKYVYYCMANMQECIYKTKKVGGVPHCYISDIKDFKIPVPPLEVQREIVRVLDSFTSLSAELSARKKQYEYYRDSLLSFENTKVEYKKLGEIADMGTGSSNTDEAIVGGTYPFYVRSQNPLRKNEYEFDETAIITAGDGAIGKVFHYVEGKYALHQRAYRIHIKDKNILAKYAFYYIQTKFYDYILKIGFRSSVSSIRRPMLNAFKIPVPPLEEQRKIVRVLDNFNAICSDLSAGLPAEIEARKKQYEYYRDKLLTFKELKIV